MRLGGKIVLCTVALTALFLGSALAAESTENYTTATDGSSVTYNAEKGVYSVSYTGSDLTENGQYVLLIVKGTVEDGTPKYAVSKDTITYIDQAAATTEGETTSVTFDTVIPSSTPDCVVLLGGTFEKGESPKVLGTLEGQGVTVSGKVTSYNPKNPVTLELYETGNRTTVVASGKIDAATTGTDQQTQNFSISSVPEGKYDLKVSKAGHASYWLTGIQVDSDLELPAISLLCGDVDGNGNINVDDLGILTSSLNYNRSADPTVENHADNVLCDINGDGNVNVDDLGILTSSTNYNKGIITETYRGGE